MAMTRDAPAMSAPLMHDRPIPPQPITATVEPGFDGGGVDDRADPRGHRAADQRRPVQRHVVADLGESVLVDEHLLGERGQVQELVDGLVPAGEPRRLVQTRASLRFAAQRHPAGQAVLAMPAEGRKTGDDVIAGTDVVNVRADGLDHAGGLVPENGRQG